MAITAQQAISNFKKFIGVSRNKLPWLAGRVNMLDCAAGYSYIAHLKPEQISCNEIRKICKTNKTWRTSDNGKTLPKPGDGVIFDWSGHQTGTDHIGMVITADKTGVTYVSADSGSHQLVTVNHVGWHYVTGWGTPVKFATK
jgi:hypothetical protein